MTTTPAVSIFLPTFRRGDCGLLRAAMESVLAQEFRDFELLAADDGSTDSTARVLSDLAARDSRVRNFRHERNAGLPARRIAELLQMSAGRYCAFMFDDDLWYPHALTTLVAALEAHPEWDMTYGNVLFPASADDRAAGRGSVLGREPRDFDPVRLQASNHIPNVAVLLRREVLDRVGVYDPHILLRRLCDWDLWLRIARAGVIGHTDVLVGEANGGATPDSLGRTASVDLELTELYMARDRDALLLPHNVLEYPVDGLDVFGESPPPMLTTRAAREFAAFYHQIGDEGQAASWERRAGAERPDTLAIAAVVVLSSPRVGVPAGVESYRSQVDEVIVVHNSGEPDRQYIAQLEGSGVTCLSLADDRGHAAALNEGCRKARDLGYDWVLTLDQDSEATPDMVARLRACVELDQPRAAQIAMIASVRQYIDGPAAATGEGSAETDVGTVTGSLIRQTALAELGGFREDLFVGGIGAEFSMRARRRGWRVVRRQDAVLLHGRCHQRSVSFPVRFRVSDNSPIRRYYMMRNYLRLRREYRREFPDWTAREDDFWRRDLVKMVLAEPRRLAKTGMLLRAWLDYRRGRFGRYEDIHAQ